jgi:prevent-host-death family protein
MPDDVGVRELRQNLSKYLRRVKEGESLVVRERGKVVAKLVPAGASEDPYVRLAEKYGATIPRGNLAETAARILDRAEGRPGWTTEELDRVLAEMRRDKF